MNNWLYRWSSRLSIAPLALLALCGGIVWLLAYLFDPQAAILVIALAYFAVVVLDVLRSRSAALKAARLLFPTLAIHAAGGLILLANDSLWGQWSMLAGFAVVPLMIERAVVADRRVYFVLVLAAMIVSVLIADDAGAQVPVGVLAVALLVVAFGVDPAGESAAKRRAITDPELGLTHVETDADALNEMSMRVFYTVDGLVRASQAINEVIKQQSAGADEQAAVIGLMNEKMDDFLQLSGRVAQQTRAMTEVSERSSTMSSGGQDAVRDVIYGMTTVREQVIAVASTIATLAQLTRRIDSIIGSVTEIATQSNLLALNASIEAARAGIHGRGFAVVADEVRSLSQQSTDAARQVQLILAEIEEAVNKTRQATETSMAGVEEGVARMQEASHVMNTLTNTVNQSQESVQSIHAVISEQTHGLEEIAISMDRVERITHQNLTGTRTVETVALNLNRLADDLQESIRAALQVPDSDLDELSSEALQSLP